MAADTVIIDISSDEENYANDSFEISDEWINDFLESVDNELQGNLDDVRILNDIFAPSCLEKPSSLPKDCSDDDCLVLDGDPDKLIFAVNGNHNSVDGLDDLVIVGEKGHLACRDYPHPRHLCLSFPFNSTPHQKHCKFCHCYVCDSPAPCIYWGIGMSTADHCHSTEKDKRWKTLRIHKRGITTASEPQCLPAIRQSQPQQLGKHQGNHIPIPNPSIQSLRTRQRARETLPHIETLSYPNNHASVRKMPPVPIYVARTTNEISALSSQTRSYPSNHASVRKMPAPVPPIYGANTSNESSAISSSQARSVSGQLRRTASQIPYNSSTRKRTRQNPLAHPMQPEASNDMNRIRGILASIEADLLDTDYSGSVAENNMPLASSPFHVFSKPSF